MKPTHFRLFLQPAMAAIFAVTDGIRDARNGEAAYFLALCTEPTERHRRIRTGWKSVGRVFILAIMMDVIYQVVVLHLVHPDEALLMAVGLAFVPYLVLGGRSIARIQHHARMTPASRT
jgi:hypothetical protein